MLSSDKNIETIAQLVEEIKRYVSIKSELIKLDSIDKIVRIVTALVLAFVILLIIGMIIIYLSFAVAYTLGDLMASLPLGFLSVSAAYLVFLLIIIAKRHSWIERPLVKFLASILLEEVSAH